MLSFTTLTPHAHWKTALNKISATTSNGKRTFAARASSILPGDRLYLSDYYTARDQLERLGITHVISVMEAIPGLEEGEAGSTTAVKRLHITIADRSDADILQYLDQTTAWIEAALAENSSNKVLVHCFQGISRSATVVCAYLVGSENHHMTADESLTHVQSQRGIVCPNLGFRKQLEVYGTRFVGKGKDRAGKKSNVKKGISSRIASLMGVKSKGGGSEGAGSP